jgi:Dolichyl-phosphate-mannose-protein mannosyltransferase
MKRTQLIYNSPICNSRISNSWISNSWISGFWIAAIAVLVALHAIHLRADFPNYSPWMDYAKYTDEGWYGKAAIEHFVLGSWYVHGDFNPGVALPVLPALEWVLFRFTGVSLVAARLLVLAVFGVNLILAYAVVRSQAPRWAGLLAASLLAVNAFLYAFSRLAILEMLLILFLLASWLLALRLPRMVGGARRTAMLIAVGLLLCLMVLTKTTAIFVAPSALFLIWHGYGYKFRESCGAMLAAAAAAALPWSAYYFFFVHPRYVFDYHYLFAANQWDHPATVQGWFAAFWYALHGALWIDGWLCALALLLMVLSAIFFRGIWKNPVWGASLLAAAGYVFFVGWHNNMQPRYYQVVAFPLVFLIALGLDGLLRAKRESGIGGRLRLPLAAACVGLAVVSSALNLRQMIDWTRHPQYSWISAAKQLTQYIDQHPNGNRLLLSISGDNITLVTHLPAICDDFGTWDLPLRIHRYQPGWYAAWNEIDPGTLLDLHTQYSLEQVAVFHAFDDPDRNQLVLYKLHPLPPGRQHYDEAFEEAGNAGR